MLLMRKLSPSLETTLLPDNSPILCPWQHLFIATLSRRKDQLTMPLPDSLVLWERLHNGGEKEGRRGELFLVSSFPQEGKVDSSQSSNPWVCSLANPLATPKLSLMGREVGGKRANVEGTCGKKDGREEKGERRTKCYNL